MRTHPALGEPWFVTFDSAYELQPVDVVVVDRLWRPDITPAAAEELVRRIGRSGARLVHAVDDNLHDLRGTLKRIPDAPLGPDLNWLVRGGVEPEQFRLPFLDLPHHALVAVPVASGQ